MFRGIKSDRFYWLTIAGLFLLILTNLATFYLYAKEKMKNRRAVKSAYQAVDHLKKDTADHIIAFRKDAQKKFLETIDSLKVNRDSADSMKQKLAVTLKDRNQKIHRFYANRNAGVGEALKIIQEDSDLLGIYNQYFQLAEERQNAVVEKIKPLGNSLGFQDTENQSGHQSV